MRVNNKSEVKKSPTKEEKIEKNITNTLQIDIKKLCPTRQYCFLILRKKIFNVTWY